jgi:8-oxo-dGTP pyrophosphatase MutT (NUDIX family)
MPLLWQGMIVSNRTERAHQHNEFALPRSLRVRAILITDKGQVLFIKRVKPNVAPYWVAPGGGVEADESLLETLDRELREELGATIEVIDHAFMLRHHKAGKDLEEHFFVCKLVDYDLSLRSGPEFDDPARGEYVPDAVDISAAALDSINIKTEELRDWLLENSHTLRSITS